MRSEVLWEQLVPPLPASGAPLHVVHQLQRGYTVSMWVGRPNVVWVSAGSSTNLPIVLAAGELGVVAERGGHSAEMSLLHALGFVASSSGASEGLVLWVLQRVQLTLATMHQRAACGE